ncbi:MAG: C39 family peptidase [candidate division KSB1 bacterium]|nr:C39 family peptidase [candidate division KSB1 bacterium]
MAKRRETNGGGVRGALTLVGALLLAALDVVFGSYPDQQYILEGADSLLAEATSVINVVSSADGGALQLVDGALTGSLVLRVQSAVYPFDVGLPSWNGSAPGDSGAFRVFIRVPYGTGWSPWLEVGYWKANLWPGTKSTTFAGGRIDIDTMELSSYVSAWQFKVEFKRLAPGVRSPTLRLLSFFASDSRRTAEFNLSEALADQPPAIFVPTRFIAQYKVSQEFGGRICSPTTVAMILASYGINVDPLAFALDTYDPYWQIFGVWPRVVQNAAEHGLRGTVARVRSWSQAYQILASGGRIGMSVGPPLYQGHLMMLAGFTAAGDPIVHDPARSADGYAHVFNKADLSRSWFEKGGVAYVFTGVCTPTAVAQTGEGQRTGGPPSTLGLLPVYPNPFSLSGEQAGLTIAFSLPRPEVVAVSIYNAVGQIVAEWSSQEFSAGRHAVQWQPEARVAPGVYFYRVVAGRQIACGRFVITK